MVFEAGATPAFFIFAIASWLVCRDVACVINPFRAQPLTGLRIGLAFVLAAIADGVQIMAGPLGWAGFDQAVDLVAMAITSYLLGFHFLLLPTFVLELVPLAGVLPTWTGCVGAVVFLRKRGDSKTAPPRPPVQTPPDKPGGPVIDI